MSKYRVDSPAGTPLDPYAFEKSIAAPNYNNPSPFSSVASSIELATPEKIDEGYGTMGNASYAVQAINEAKARDQGTLELVAKGVGNVARTIAVEAGKTPGYFGGVLGAIGNEIAGDGKNSMSYIVDNAWVKAFNGLDKSVQDMMPVYISQQVQEGNLWDKLGSGGWWATTGANGVGFMLSMFLPGMAAKALGVGEKIAAGTEFLANTSTRLGKAATGESWVSKLGLMTAPDDAIRTATELASKLPGATEESVALAGKLAGETAQIGYKYTKEFARNANGVSSAILNTTLEASAEAANTFENLTNTYMQQGMSEEEAKQKAGEGAAAVFKGNLALLTVSNLLDEAWLWKSFGSAGEKEAAKSLLEKVTKNGVVDLEELKRIPKEFTRASVLKKTGGNFLKNVLKEGVYEEGTQTTLQQNIEKGKKGENFLDDLYNVGASYLDDFSNNTELHESVFLGGLLGGGASIFSTVRENNDLKKAYYGGEARTKDNSIFAKYGILPETKAQKGILAVLGENHIKQFRTYKDLLDKTEDGKYELNEKKVTDANLEQVDSFRTNVLYDLAVQNNDKLGQEIYGQFLAADYVHGFLGQEGSKEMFEDHVDNHVLPAWQKRFEETFGRPATEQESAKYIQNFKQSGNRVIDAYTQAEQTNYPERYFHEKTKQYQDFKNKYFHDKFETLVLLDSIASRRAQVQEDLVKAGVTEEDLQNLSKISNPVKRQNAEDIRDEIEQLNELEQKTAEKYKTFYTKEGVKDMFDKYKKQTDLFNEVTEELKKQNEELKKKVDAIPQRNANEITRLQELARSEGHEDDNVSVRDKSGKLSTIEELKKDPSDITEKGFELDDVSKSEYESFKNTGEASQEVLKKITEKLTKSEPLSKRESEIYEAEKPKVQALLDAELTSLKDKVNPVQSLSEEDSSEKLDKAIDEVDDETRKKGVNLYPSTGRNLLSQLVPYKGNFVEAMTPKASQQLWFQVLDEEVSKDPTKYTVKVVRRDDKSNRELHEQIKEVSEEGNSNPTDLYVVLYKDGKPVIKGGKSNSVPKSPRATDEESIRLSQQWVNETFDKLQTLAANGPIEIFSNQKTYTLKPVFNGFIIEFEGQTLLNSTKRFNKNDIKMWFGEGFDIPNSTKGNYVFTGLWRPNTLYPVKKSGKTSSKWKSKRAKIGISLDQFLVDNNIKLPDTLTNFIRLINSLNINVNFISRNAGENVGASATVFTNDDGTHSFLIELDKNQFLKYPKSFQIEAIAHEIVHLILSSYSANNGITNFNKRVEEKPSEFLWKRTQENLPLFKKALELRKVITKSFNEKSKQWFTENGITQVDKLKTIMSIIEHGTHEFNSVEELFTYGLTTNELRNYLSLTGQLKTLETLFESILDTTVGNSSEERSGVPGKFVLAKRIVVESFLIHLRLKDLDLNKLSQNQKDTLTKAGVTEFTEDGIATAAFFYAKDDYTKWYNSLVENPGFLNINGITNGHRPKVYSDPKGENPVWGKPLEGIQGLRLDGNRLVGGKLELSTKGTVKTGTGEYNVPIGSTVLIDDQHNLHPMRARNLTQDEMRTVAYLLSLRSQSGPTESIMVSAPGKIQFGTEVLKKVPVFFAEASKNIKGKTRANIIESLISFGHKDGMKGEMYWNKETLDKDPILVYTDFDGVTKNIAVSKIKDAVDNEKFEDIQDFMNFLAQKRFNVNNQLLGTTQTSAIFSKPKLTYKVDNSGKRVPDLDWDQSRSYFDHLLNDVLTTTTQKIDGYPARAQRNLYFDPKPIPQIVLDSQSEKIEPVKETTKEVVDSDKSAQTNSSKKEALAKLLEERKNKRKDLSDYADKVLTTDELIKQKLQNGEIIKNCK